MKNGEWRIGNGKRRMGHGNGTEEWEIKDGFVE